MPPSVPSVSRQISKSQLMVILILNYTLIPIKRILYIKNSFLSKLKIRHRSEKPWFKHDHTHLSVDANRSKSIWWRLKPHHYWSSSVSWSRQLILSFFFWFFGAFLHFFLRFFTSVRLTSDQIHFSATLNLKASHNWKDKYQLARWTFWPATTSRLCRQPLIFHPSQTKFH